MFSFSTFRKISLLGLLLLLSIQAAFAQKLTLNGKVSDGKTDLPIEGVTVGLSNSGKATITSKNGSFSLQADTVLPGAFLTFSHIGYEPFTVKLKAGQTFYAVKLNPKTTTISEIKITATKKLQPAKIQPETVLDFALTNNRLYLLYWEAKQKNPTLKVLNPQTDSLLLRMPLPVYAKKLYVDCLQNLHLLTDDLVYQAFTDSVGFQLYPPVSKLKFDQLIDPCQATDGQWAYFRRGMNKNIILSFFAVDLATQQSKLLQTIADKEVLIMQKKEARFQRFRAKMHEDKEAKYQDVERLSRSAARSAEFGQHFMIRGPYVPLLKVGKEICIFDHVNGNIEFYQNNSLSSVTPIQYHHQKNWAKQNLVDPVKEKAYVVFTRNGLPELKLLNLETGELENSYKIANPFASKITVHSGQVYFLYKDMANNNRQHLYKAALNTL